jgi:long-chain acyl-CoA synthetase
MWTNLGKLINHSKNPDAVALIDCFDVDHPRHYTHGELDRLPDACARGLMRRGVKRGDAVALMSTNRAEFLIAYFAIMRAGMIAVPINHKLAAETITFALQDCGAKLVFVDGERVPLVPNGLPRVRMDDETWDQFLDAGAFEAVRPTAEECAMILYTSGSTGRPTGVQLSHAGQLWALEVRVAAKASFEDERLIVAAPLFHMNALISCKFAIAAHASIVLMAQFDARDFTAAIGKYAVTWITSVPTMMAMVVRETDALAAIDGSKVRYVRMGSAPATQQLHDAVHRAFPNAAVAGGYGTTEAGPVVFGPTEGRALPGGDALGWPQPAVEVRLVGPDDSDAEQGELWMRTPANMLGYLNMPERTRQVLTNDNWYKSGDIFRRDTQGCYSFVGRADDMFNCGGENIYPGEVEKVIERIPDVMQACVVPIEDEIKGQKPVAFVVLRSGASVSEDEIKKFVLENAPAYQHPRRVFFTKALPLAATNKIDRRQLAQLAQQSR